MTRKSWVCVGTSGLLAAGQYPGVVEQLSRAIDAHLPQRFAAYDGS